MTLNSLFDTLEPKDEREGLLYLKAYVTGIEAALSTVEKFGLEAARTMHEQVMLEIAEVIRKLTAQS